MVVVPLAPSETESLRPFPSAPDGRSDSRYWIRIAAAASLATSGVLLMSGKRRAGMVAAAAGTALTVVDQQEVVRKFWSQLPGYLEDVQRFLTQAQSAVDELSVQGERLRTILTK